MTQKRARKTKPKNTGKVQPDRFQKASAKAKAAETEAEKAAKVAEKAAAKAAKEAEKAAAKAAKEAEKAAEQAAKEKVQAAAIKTLAPIAKEVDTRLEKAAKNQQQADDHRLAAALRLAEAKNVATEAGVSFKTWAEEHIKQQSFETVRKLAAVGASDNPAEALAEMRERNKAANKKLRDGTKDKGKSGKSAPAKTPVDTALDAIDKMDEGTRKRLIESVASNEGLVVQAKSSKKDEAKNKIEVGSLKAAQAAFLALPRQERADFVAWAQDKINLDAEAEAEGSAGEIPSFLDRRSEGKRRTRKTKPKK